MPGEQTKTPDFPWSANNMIQQTTINQEKVTLMKKISIILLCLFAAAGGFTQNVAINADGTLPDPTAMLDVQSTSKGFLPPRMTVLQRTGITDPATGLLVFQTDDVTGYYYYSGTAWTRLAESGVVTGSVVSFAGASAPAGYLLCQGQAVSRTTYAALFAVIGTTYGTGDGSTTFNLPDLRTRVPVGLNSSGTFNALNNRGGAETHTITQAQLPNYTLSNTLSVNNTGSGHQHYLDLTTPSGGSHTHDLAGGFFAPSVSGSWGGTFLVWNGSGGWQNGATSTGSSHTHTVSGWSSSSSTSNQYGAHTHGISGSVSSGGSGSSMPILQPYIVLNYIIKY